MESDIREFQIVVDNEIMFKSPFSLRQIMHNCLEFEMVEYTTDLSLNRVCIKGKAPIAIVNVFMAFAQGHDYHTLLNHMEWGM